MRRPGLAGVGAGSFVNVTVKRVARKTVSVARVAAVACARATRAAGDAASLPLTVGTSQAYRA
jgi:ribose 5-phosphate isomerase